MTTRPIKRNTINLDGTNYTIEGTVQRELASTFPQKIVTGDFQEESHPFVSTVSWTDFRGGMLKETAELPGDQNRSYFSTLNTNHKGHLFLLPGEFTALGTFSGAPSQMQKTAGDFIGGFALTDSQVIRLALTSGVWATSSTAFTDVTTGRINGTTVVAATDSDKGVSIQRGVGSSADFNDSSFKPRKLAIWRDLLWGITDSGTLHFTNNAEAGSTTLTWTQVAAADLGSKAQGLIVGPDKNLYAVGANGLHFYDNETEAFDNVFDFGGHSSVSGQAFDVWNGAIYLADRMSVFQFIPGFGAGPSVVTEMGLDLEDGLPRDYQGEITQLAHTNHALYANIKADDSLKFSAVYKWNGSGWHAAHHSKAVNRSRDAGGMFIGQAASGVGAFSGPGLTVGFTDSGASDSFLDTISLKQSTRIPQQSDSNTAFAYNAHGSSVNYLTTPWVVPDGNQEWTALSLEISHSFHTLNSTVGPITDSDAITVSYGKDFNDSFTDLFTVTGVSDSAGTTKVEFPAGAGDKEGLPFTAFRVKVGMKSDPRTSGGKAGLTTPDVHRITLSYVKTLDPLWGFRFVIDTANQPQFGASAKEVRETLKALFEKKTLFNFTFKGDAAEEESYLVKPIGMQSAEGTGTDESGQYVLTVVEVN